MKINKLVEEALSENAVELLNLLAANALAAPQSQTKSLFTLAVEPENWNATMQLIREIFDAEILIASDPEWVSFRILQSIGVNHGKLAYQFTPAFTETLST